MDVWWTEKGHLAMAGLWRAAHNTFGIIAMAGSVVATAAIFAKKHPLVAGVAAVIAGLASGTLTVLKPDQIAERHLTTGRALADLRVKIRQVRNLDLPRSLDTPELRETIGDLGTRKAQIDDQAPHVSNLAVWWVDRRKKKGAFGESVPD